MCVVCGRGWLSPSVPAETIGSELGARPGQPTEISFRARIQPMKSSLPATALLTSLFITSWALPAAAESIEAILAVPGVDALCIGPNDLSGSAGVLRQHDHPVVRGAIDKILSAASARGVAVCTGITLPLEQQQDWIARGARLALLTSDVELLAGGAAGILAAARAELA